MKIANVVSVQSRGTPVTPTQDVRAGSRADRMSSLLRRYPEIEDQERLELLNFLTLGPQEEIVNVTHLQGLTPRYEAFRKDHPREFRSGLRGWLPMILVIAVALVGVAWRTFS